MSDYILSCCSTADLTKEHFETRDISYICFHYEMDGKQYPDDLGQTMDFDTFYKAMANGADTKTSQVNADEFESYFEGFLKQGKENQIQQITEDRALALMLNNTWRPGHSEGMNRLLDMIEQTVTQIQVYEMSCTRNREAAELSYRVMKGK